MSQLYLSSTSSPSVATTYTTDDSNTATPDLNNLNIFATGNITTTSTGSTVTISENSAFVTTNYTAIDDTNSPYSVISTDYFISVDTSTAAVTVQLPDSPTNYRSFIIKDRNGNASSNNITITTVGGAVLIDGSTTAVLAQNYESADLIFNGTSYEIY